MAIVIHLTEVVVHGFDLAVATYQDSMDEGLSEQLSTTNVHGRHGRLPGTRIFGPEVTVSDDAPAPQTAGVVGLGRTTSKSRAGAAASLGYERREMRIRTTSTRAPPRHSAAALGAA
jgi:hypothetical protein